MRSTTRDWRVWAIGLGVVVVLGAGLYLAGRWQERGRAARETEALEARLAEAADERERARAETAATRARLRLVQARALLLEAALDLERRNFGTANERLDAAAAELQAVEQGIANAAALQALRREVAAMDLRVATNLAAQRARVLELAARVQDLLEPPPATSRP